MGPAQPQVPAARGLVKPLLEGPANQALAGKQTWADRRPPIPRSC